VRISGIVLERRPRMGARGLCVARRAPVHDRCMPQMRLSKVDAMPMPEVGQEFIWCGTPFRREPGDVTDGVFPVVYLEALDERIKVGTTGLMRADEAEHFTLLGKSCGCATLASPYLDALQRYSDAWYTLALDHGMQASVAASHAKHVQDAINGLRSQLSEDSAP
jgi:hypothetical protein